MPASSRASAGRPARLGLAHAFRHGDRRLRRLAALAAQLVIGLIIVLQTAWVRPEYFSAEFGLYPVWPRFDPVRALQLFALTMGILLARSSWD